MVDAAQGVEAQTLANVYLAIEHDLEIVPVINKIDLPQRRARARSRKEIEDVVGIAAEDVILRSRPRPGTASTRCSKRSSSASRRRTGDADAPLRALIFDSQYDAYKGVDRLRPRHRRRAAARATKVQHDGDTARSRGDRGRHASARA